MKSLIGTLLIACAAALCPTGAAAQEKPGLLLQVVRLKPGEAKRVELAVTNGDLQPSGSSGRDIFLLNVVSKGGSTEKVEYLKQSEKGTFVVSPALTLVWVADRPAVELRAAKDAKAQTVDLRVSYNSFGAGMNVGGFRVIIAADEPIGLMVPASIRGIAMQPRFLAPLIAGLFVAQAGADSRPRLARVRAEGNADGLVGAKDKAPTGRELHEIVERLQSPDATVRRAAVQALNGVPTKAAVPALTHALGDSDAVVAELAAKGLGLIGGDAAPAVPALRKHLDNPQSEESRDAVIVALGRIGAQAAPAVSQLVGVVREPKMPTATRRAAVAALGNIGPSAKAAVRTLTEVLAEADLEQAAVVALIQMGPEARPASAALSKRLKADRPYWLDLAWLLAEIDPPAARPALADLRALAASEPIRDRGIVIFRDSQLRIALARALLKRLEPKEN